MRKAVMTQDQSQPAWIEVDLSALVHNYRTIRTQLEGRPLIPVVKADGYGLGGLATALVYQALGAKLLAVSTLSEARALREGGIKTDILLLLPFTEEAAEEVLELGLIPALSALWQIGALREALARRKEARKKDPRPRLHLKLETGLGRTGLGPEDLAWLLEDIKAKDDFILEGIFSHFADATNEAYSSRQLDRFLSMADLAARAFPDRSLVRHMANSSAICSFSQAYLDAGRPGTLLYGQHPAGAKVRLDLRDPFKACARVLSVQTVAKGSSMGYGLDQVAKKPTRLALLGLGTADGLMVRPQRLHSSLFSRLRNALAGFYKEKSKRDPFSQVHIGEKTFTLVGRVAMQSALVEVDESVERGQVARVFLLRLMASDRLPRRYTYQGQVVPLEDIEKLLQALKDPEEVGPEVSPKE